MTIADPKPSFYAELERLRDEHAALQPALQRLRDCIGANGTDPIGAVIDKVLCTLDAAKASALTWHRRSIGLWMLLDGISTAADAAKGDHEAFYKLALCLIASRDRFAYSPDGHTTVWREPVPPRLSHAPADAEP